MKAAGLPERLPVADNIPGEEMPMFRNLWAHIGKKMPKKGRGNVSVLDPLSIPVERHFNSMIHQWQKDGWQKNNAILQLSIVSISIFLPPIFLPIAFITHANHDIHPDPTLISVRLWRDCL